MYVKIFSPYVDLLVTLKQNLVVVTDRPLKIFAPCVAESQMSAVLAS